MIDYHFKTFKVLNTQNTHTLKYTTLNCLSALIDKHIHLNI